MTDVSMSRYKNKGTLYPYSRLYTIWMNMRNRCNNKNCHKYDRYGGRGIKVATEWDSYDAFEQWALNNGYSDNLTIDRIDNNKGYSPQNCRWTTAEVQANNRSTSALYTYNGETHTLANWAKIKGINYKTLTNRIYRGGTFDVAITTPIDERKRRR